MVTRRTVLVLAANPKDTPPLQLDREVQEIQAALTKTGRKRAFRVRQAWAVSPRDVRRALLEHRPYIVHFCGHGSGDQGLHLESNDGASHMVSGSALSGLFALFEDTVGSVVLNACFSITQAEAIASHINHVIGMSREIGDKAAIEFAGGFYDAVSVGESIEKAFQFGCNAISLSGQCGEHVPVIMKKQPKQPGTENSEPVMAVRDARSATNQCSVASFHDLWNAGMSTGDVLKRLIEIDYENITGLDALAEGTSEQWVDVAQNNPDGYAFVIDRAKQIVGYWHFEAVDDAIYSSLIGGTFEDSDLTIDNVRFLCCPGDYNIYFIIFVVRKPYRGYRVNRMLYDAFLQKMQSLEQEGIRVVNVCANAFTPEGVGLCKSLGMRQVGTHERMGIVFEKRRAAEGSPTGRNSGERLLARPSSRSAITTAVSEKPVNEPGGKTE